MAKFFTLPYGCWTHLARYLPSGCCRDSHHVAWRAFRVATVSILATANPTPGANIGIEIKIMTSGTSIEAHTTRSKEPITLAAQ
jgi:hypothetical protein